MICPFYYKNLANDFIPISEFLPFCVYLVEYLKEVEMKQNS